MGGLFLRKVCGVASLAYHTTKLWPIIFQFPPMHNTVGKTNGRVVGGYVGTSWSAGHYDPLLLLSIVGNACIAMFYLTRMDELKDAGAHGMGLMFVLASFIESFVFAMYLLSRRMSKTKVTAAKSTKTRGSGKEEVVDNTSKTTAATTKERSMTRWKIPTHYPLASWHVPSPSYRH